MLSQMFLSKGLGSYLTHPELKDLANRLPDIILHSRANNTVKKYLGTFRGWKRWVWRKLVMHCPGCTHVHV